MGKHAQPPARPGLPEPHFPIADAERIGFVKGDQQKHPMIGASDGWSGTLAGDTVELYSFNDSIPHDFFRAWAEKDNGHSEWAGYCQVGNPVMVYRRPEACDALRRVQTQTPGSPSSVQFGERTTRS